MKQDQYLTSQYDKSLFQDEDLISLMQRNAALYENKTVYYLLEDGINEKESITYGELVRRAKSVAASMQEKGSKGDRVILLFPTGISFITSLLGCFFAGMIGVPTYPPKRNKANERFKSILENARPEFILTEAGILSDLEKHFSNEPLINDIKKLDFSMMAFGNEDKWTNPGITPDDIAMLQYTSGSTGVPHGVMVSHFNMIHNCKYIHDSFGFSNETVGVNWLPNFHDMGLIGCLMQVVYIGAVNVIVPPMAFLKDPANWLKAISRYNANTTGGPNFAFDYAVEKISDEDVAEINLDSITTLFCGAEPIRAETFKRFSEKFKDANFTENKFYPCYGLAESVLIVSGGDYKADPIYFDVDAKALEENIVKPASDGNELRTLTACGYAWHGTSIAIVDKDTQKLSPSGQIGEIWTKGPSVAKGYWNDKEGTEKTFNAFIAGTDDGPWMRTGDLGFIHEGQLYVTGRLKDLIIIRGSNFFPNDIEYSLENCHEALRQNASAAFSTDLNGEERLVIVAEVERAFVRDLPEDEVFEAIRAAVFSEFGIQPRAITLIRTGSILKTSSGKIKRFAMRTAWLKGELTEVASWIMKPQKENVASAIGFRPEFLREWMINWMAQTLEIDPGRINPDKAVSSYGLDSITAVSLERDVNNQFGVEWPIESFLKDNTVNQLVEEGIALLKQRKEQ